MLRVPVAIVILTVWVYWISVLLMILRSRFKLNAAAGAVPQTGLERWMWMIWVPTVFAWLLVPPIGYLTTLPFLRVPPWAVEQPQVLLDWLAAAAAVFAYLATIPCWLTLGSNWSLAVVPGKETQLVTRSFYARMRHPIYALGLLLMAATVVAAPSAAMLVVGCSHLALVLLKSTNEERFLEQRHGQVYLDYCRKTRRFLPWPKRCGLAVPGSRTDDTMQSTR
jgi:protein-S-isoprenylcysteine O-methyltransferase Ste14